MTDVPHTLAATVQRFSGFAREYDRYRPQPPAALAPLLARYTDTARPTLVVDLGSGTGLSSRYWGPHALQVIGIEPSTDMRDEAVRQTTPANVRYQPGYSHDTGLSAQCAQIVTCMQALHWMEPQGTFAEAHRVLLKAGYSGENLGIGELERLARAELGDEPRPWYWSARVRIGVV